MNDSDRAILRLAVPALGTLAIEPLYILVDTAIVGHLGTAPLGGLAIAATILTTAFWAFNFLAYGTTARVAFLVGRGDSRGVSGTAVQGLWLAGLIGVVSTCTVVFGGRQIALALGGSGEVLHAAVTYLRISAAGIPFVLVSLVGTGYLRGVSDTRTPLAVAFVANVVNLALEVWFVYGLHWGVAGSAWGTVVAQVLSAAWFAVALYRRVRGAPLRPNATELRLLVASGQHLVVRTGALLATLALATAVAARTSPVVLAAHQIAMQVWTFLALAVDALAIAAQTVVGTALGAGDVAAARATGRRVIQWSIAVGVVLGLGIVVSSGVLPHVFTSKSAVTRVATVGLVAVGLSQIPAAAVFALDGILIGASDFKFLKWGTLGGLAAFAPFAFLVLRRPSLGIAGIWAGLGAWIVARLVINGSRFAGERWHAVTRSGTVA